jgi:hypothetical protein
VLTGQTEVTNGVSKTDTKLIATPKRKKKSTDCETGDTTLGVAVSTTMVSTDGAGLSTASVPEVNEIAKESDHRHAKPKKKKSKHKSSRKEISVDTSDKLTVSEGSTLELDDPYGESGESILPISQKSDKAPKKRKSSSKKKSKDKSKSDRRSSRVDAL